VLLTGAGGQLGQTVARDFTPNHDVTACDRAALDIADRQAVARMADSVKPDLIINCAAYNNVDGAEDHPDLALASNTWGVRALAEEARTRDIVLVHYGSDFVFDGFATRPYTEEDAPSPRGAYATSKLLGDWFAAEAPRHYVLRVESLFGGARAKSSVDHLLSGILAGREITVFADRAVSPSHVDDVSRATMALVAGGALHGLYHCVNSGWTNWLELARELARLAGRPDAPIVPIKLADARLRAPRPLFAALDNGKLLRAGAEMPSWQDSLARYVRSVMR
jgi:dTDP-4-dehydrorhamnose reductase